MTFAQVWTYLRWPLAIVGLLAIANYAISNLSMAAGGMIEFDASGSILAPDSPSESPEPLDTAALPDAVPATGLQPGTGPVTDGIGTAIADFSVNDTIADATGEELVLSDDPGDIAVVAFDIPDGDPACMDVVTLNLTISDLVTATEIGVFVSSVDDPAAVPDNGAVDGDGRGSPVAIATALGGEPGTLSVDITQGYQEYFTLDLPERPLVLTVAPTVPVEPQGGISFESVDAGGETPPTLLWTGAPGCSGGTAGTGPALGGSEAATELEAVQPATEQ